MSSSPLRVFFSSCAALSIAMGLFFASLPTSSAADFLTFSLQPGKVNANWTGYGPIRIAEGENGLTFSTTTGTGIVMTQLAQQFHPDAVRFITETPIPIELLFAWVGDIKNLDFPDIVRLDIGEGRRVTEVDLTQVPTWNDGRKNIGFVLPPHTSITVSLVEFAEWNFFEKCTSLLRSFWKFDMYQPYTINFVWGPQLASNPVGTAKIFTEFPPLSLSAMFVGNIILLLCLIAGILRGVRAFSMMERKKTLLQTLFCGILVIWVLFDVRMGVEFLTYVQKDISEFVFAPKEFRTLRERDSFYAFADIARPLVTDRERYNFLAPQEWPYLGNIRYLTYPALPSNRFSEDDTWVIFARPDMVINAQQQLTLQGEPLTEPGHVLAGPFPDGSLIFRGKSLPL